MSKLTELMNQRLQEHFNGNESELARAVNTSQQNINNFLTGKVGKPHYWKEAAKALGIPIPEFEMLRRLDRQLHPSEAVSESVRVALENGTVSYRAVTPLAGRERSDAIIQASKMPSKTTARMLPVLGEAVGGADGRYIFNGSILDYVSCPPSLENVPNAYAVFIDGESMSPRYMPGETVWVHPSKPARRGDDVIVQVHPIDDDGSPPFGYVKRFVGWTANKLVLHQFNPDSAVEFDRAEVVSVHPIVLSGKY